MNTAFKLIVLLLATNVVCCYAKQFTVGRIRAVAVRSADENGAAVEISPLEAHNFGKRSLASAVQQSSKTSIQQTQTSTTTSTPTTAALTTTTTTTQAPAPSTTTTTTQEPTTRKAAELKTSFEAAKSKSTVSERQQLESSAASVDIMASAPSWQVMTAVSAPQIALESNQETDLLRSTTNSFATKGGSLKQQKHTFFKQQQASKTSNYAQETKTHWYKPTTTTTQRPAPIVQQQHYEQQQVEQQVEYGAAPLGQAEPFAFDFKTEDNNGNGQYRKEESDKDGVVRGSYGYTDANGIYRHVSYIADSNGFRANIKSNEPGMDGETQPASVQLAASEAPKSSLTSPRNLRPSNSEPANNDWTSNSNSNNNINDKNEDGSELAALMNPDFESSHKPERVTAERLRQL